MRPSRRSRDRTRLSRKPSSDASEDRFDSVNARNRLVDDRRQLARAGHVESAPQHLELFENVEEADGLRQQREVVEPTAVFDRICECVGMAPTRLVRISDLDRQLANLQE